MRLGNKIWEEWAAVEMALWLGWYYYQKGVVKIG